MSLHPLIQKTLNFIYAGGREPLHFMSPAVARAHYEATHAFLDMPLPQVDEVRDIIIPGPAGEIAARVYCPQGTAGHGDLPVMVYFHGGGWVIGSIKTHDRVCRYMANAAKAVVVSVDYRLAPEHKFPAGFEDCLAAVTWVSAHGGEIGADARHLAVAGDSAGGNLAAALTHWCRDHGGPHIAYQILIYPVTDPLEAGYASRSRYSEGYFLEQSMIDWFLAQYVSSPVDGGNILVSPLRAENFAGLPPAFITTAGLDPLCDEGKAYADKLSAAGVPVTYRCHEQMIHGFITMGGLIPDARHAMNEAAHAFRKQL
jgi:acetyl esterase